MVAFDAPIDTARMTASTTGTARVRGARDGGKSPLPAAGGPHQETAAASRVVDQ